MASSRKTQLRTRRAALATFTLCAGLAGAQTLDFGGTPIPTLTGATHLEETSAALARQADQLSRAASTPGNRAAIGLRRLAIALLANPDDDRPERVIAGLTLADHLPAFDALLLRDAADSTAAAAEFLADDLTLAPGDVPLDAEELDRFLRSALAELLWAASGANLSFDGTGWVAEPSDTDHAAALAAFETGVPQWVSAPGVSPAAGVQLNALALTIREGLKSPAFAPAAAMAQHRLVRAAIALTSTEPWLTSAAREVIGREFSAGCEGLLAPELRLEALERLEALSALGEVITLAARLEPGPATDAAHEALCSLVESPAPPVQRAERLRAIARILNLAADRARQPAERSLVRQARPAWRVLLVQARATEQDLASIFTRAITDPAAMTDPAIVGAISAHRRSIDDLTALARLSTLLTGSAAGDDPAALDTYRPLADLIVRLGQDLDDQAKSSAALTRLRSLCAQATVLEPMPGEADLRRATSGDAWSRLTGARAAELARAIDAARERWSAAWSGGVSEDEAARAAAALRGLERLMAALDDGVIIESLTTRADDSALDAWPGWRLERTALALAWKGAPEQMAETTRLALAGEAARAAARLDRFETDFAFPRLVARLERQARLRGLTHIDPNDAAAALRELASGPPDPFAAWLAPQRRELALLCRYAAELPRATQQGHATTERQIREFLADRAARLK